MTAPPTGHEDLVDVHGQAVPTFKTVIRNTDTGSNAGLPGIRLAAGLTAEGLPLGLALFGALGAHRHIVAGAAAIARVLPALPRPPMVQA